MRPIPDIVKEHVLKTCGRIPQTDKEVDDYLDLINHAKEYADAVKYKEILGIKGMKRLGLKTPQEIKRQNPFKK